MEDYVDDADFHYLSRKGTYEQLIADATLSKGIDSYVFDELDLPGTKWVLYAFQVNRNLRRVGKVSYTVFTVPE